MLPIGKLVEVLQLVSASLDNSWNISDHPGLVGSGHLNPFTQLRGVQVSLLQVDSSTGHALLAFIAPFFVETRRELRSKVEYTF